MQQLPYTHGTLTLYPPKVPEVLSKVEGVDHDDTAGEGVDHSVTSGEGVGRGTAGESVDRAGAAGEGVGHVTADEGFGRDTARCLKCRWDLY